MPTVPRCASGTGRSGPRPRPAQSRPDPAPHLAHHHRRVREGEKICSEDEEEAVTYAVGDLSPSRGGLESSRGTRDGDARTQGHFAVAIGDKTTRYTSYKMVHIAPRSGYCCFFLRFALGLGGFGCTPAPPISPKGSMSKKLMPPRSPLPPACRRARGSVGRALAGRAVAEPRAGRPAHLIGNLQCPPRSCRPGAGRRGARRPCRRRCQSRQRGR